jgi:hypothetical protein
MTAVTKYPAFFFAPVCITKMLAPAAYFQDI